MLILTLFFAMMPLRHYSLPLIYVIMAPYAAAYDYYDDAMLILPLLAMLAFFFILRHAAFSLIAAATPHLLFAITLYYFAITPCLFADAARLSPLRCHDAAFITFSGV